MAKIYYGESLLISAGAVHDRAIDALIAEKSRNSSPVYMPPSYIPPAPIWTTTPVLCRVQ